MTGATMGVRTASQWLQAWETSSALEAVRRPLELLRAATAARSTEDFLDLPLGRRDVLLLNLRMALFGEQMRCKVGCPGCEVVLELDFDLNLLRDTAPPNPPDRLSLDCDGFSLSFRAPTTRDQMMIAGCSSTQEARQLLLGACVSDVSLNGRVIALDALPEFLIERVVRGMQALDPQAASGIELHCPSCGTVWEADFDIAQCLWAELDNWAAHLLLDVNDLARAYGWSESEILALTPGRRRRYVGMVAA
jgi:hypothetical protein